MNNNGLIAKEGWPYIAYTTGLTLLLALSAWKLSSMVLMFPAVISLLAALFTLYFFRNPERTPPADERAVVSPADGTVVVAEQVSESPCGGAALKISVFMSVFNVHVNRIPFSGKIIDIIYTPGSFFDARDKRASAENERSAMILETVDGLRIAFVQIAGLIARRIVCYPKAGDTVSRGHRYGIIRFGSRVDIFLPPETRPLVQPGNHTVAGETVLARLGVEKVTGV